MNTFNPLSTASVDTVARALKKAHVDLLRHPETRLYSGVILLGDSLIVDHVPTACTNGRDKLYGREFMSKRTPAEVCGVVLHEALHVALKHLFRHEDLMDLNPQLANVAMDYVVNDVIHNITGYGQWIVLPPDNDLYDAKFHGWSVREVFFFLYKGRDKDGKQHEGGFPGKPKQDSGTGDSQPDQAKTPDEESDKTPDEIKVDGKTYKTKSHDEHDREGAKKLAEEKAKQKKAEQDQDAEGSGKGEGGMPEGAMGNPAPSDSGAEDLCKEIDEVMQQSAIMAGVMGLNLPQTIKEAMIPPTDWTEVMSEYVTSATKGSDDVTWRRLNRRRFVDDLFLPDVESETIEEILVCIDSSGSTIGPVLDKFCETLSAVAQACQPERVRVLYWDTEIRGEQIFTNDYTNLRQKLQVRGGGGTRVGCIPPHVMRNNINPNCVLVLTDGYVEHSPAWDMMFPTLWVVTENKHWTPPKGRLVHTN